MTDTQKTIRELETERNILLDRCGQISNAIALLQSFKDASEADKRRRKPMAKYFRTEDMKGVVLGNIPVRAKGEKKVKAKPVKPGKRTYTKRAEFWKKPHPRKKK